MAWATSIRPTKSNRGGVDHYQYKFTGTSIGTSSEFILEGAPKIGTITHQKIWRTSGSGATTIQPAYGAASGWTVSGPISEHHISQATATHTLSNGAWIDNTSGLHYDLSTISVPDGKIYGNIKVNAGTDSFTVIIDIKEGH